MKKCKLSASDAELQGLKFFGVHDFFRFGLELSEPHDRRRGAAQGGSRKADSSSSFGEDKMASWHVMSRQRIAC